MDKPARSEPVEFAECVECEELGCPTEGMTYMCPEVSCRYAMVCMGHDKRHEEKHKAERESESCCGEGCTNCNR